MNQNKTECKCACHEKKLKKSYEHDTKCCENMNGKIKQPIPMNDWEIEFKKGFIKILNNFSHNEGYERGVTHLFYKNNDMSDPQYLCRNDEFWDRLEPGGLLLRNDILNFIRAQIDLERKKVIEEIRKNLPKVITPTVEPPPNQLSQNQIFA